MSDEKDKREEEYELEEYSFITEKIKKKPLNKKKMMITIGSTALLAVLFGTIACFAFFAVKPIVENHMNEEVPPKVTLPEEEEEAEDPAASASGQTPEEDNNQLEISDFEKLYDELYSVSQNVKKSVVTVTGVVNGVDWFDNPYDNPDPLISYGFIFVNNEQELLILTEMSVAENSSEIKVTFHNGYETAAEAKKYDRNTGLAVIGIPLGNIDYNSAGEIASQVGMLGSSNSVKQGEPVIALGNPLGYNTVTYGFITSNTNTVNTLDANYKILTTDMAGSSNRNGVLVNLKGEVVGIINSSNDETHNTITCYGISEVKDIITSLSNNEDIPYIGIKCATVTEEIAAEQELEQGVFVTEVMMNQSPALEAKIERGDIITEFNGAKIKTVSDYTDKLMECQPGDQVDLNVKRQGAEGYIDIVFQVDIGVY